ncbi:MAG: cyclase family protein [Dehalococcoidia bacterium]|nr:cyclase family protein [Dehalococcoidia bacterium]
MRKVTDLTYPIHEHWRWFFQLRTHSTHDNGFFFNQYMDFNPHGFTHVDAPVHYIPHGTTMDQVPLSQFMGDSTVVNLSHLGQNGPVSADELNKHGQHVRAGDIVLLRTDWPLKCDYMSRDFWSTAPYTTADACEWLVERRVKTVGYDYPPDYALRYGVLNPGYVATSREEYPTHAIFFDAGIFVIEYVRNLHLIESERFQFIALPLAITGGDGSPVRAIAVED